MSIRLKTIIGIVLIETIALAIVVWSNLHVLVQSNEQLLSEQARAVAKMAAEPAARASKRGPEAFRQETRRLRAADPRIAWVRVLDEDAELPQSSDQHIVRTVEIRDAQNGDLTTRVSLAIDRGTMLAARDSALIRSIAIAGLEIVASIAFSLWLAGWLLGRLGKLQSASQRIADGDFSQRLNVGGNDEISDTALAFNMMAVRLSTLVDQVRDETSRRESIEAELRVAREIQDSLHPAACPLFPGHPTVEVEAVDDPLREVAGDFYDWFAIDDHRLGLVIADVAGKGVPAGLFAAACLTVIRTLARTGLEPTNVLDRANQQLSEHNPEQMFATLGFLHLDVATGEVNAAVAGHPAARIIRKSGEIEQVLARTGPIFGVIPNARWEQTTCKLEPGDRLVLVTDGVLEARNQDGVMLGDAGFDEMLAEAVGLGTAETARRIAWSVRKREGDQPSDDLTVVVISPTDGTPDLDAPDPES
jgi:sigma-B regulation protein RsbU (phosphoserine phosphatase)